MEHWELDHERGHIELFTGSSAELQEIDPEFPDGNGEHRLLVTVDGVTRYRGRRVYNENITLEKIYTAPRPGKYGGALDYSKPLLKITSDILGRNISLAWVDTKDGTTAFEAPAGSCAERRNAERQRSRLKGWLYSIEDLIRWQEAWMYVFFIVPFTYAVVNLMMVLFGWEPERLVSKLFSLVVLCLMLVAAGFRWQRTHAFK